MTTVQRIANALNRPKSASTLASELRLDVSTIRRNIGKIANITKTGTDYTIIKSSTAPAIPAKAIAKKAPAKAVATSATATKTAPAKAAAKTAARPAPKSSGQ